MIQQKTTQAKEQTQESLHRWKLARIITIISIMGIGVVAALVIIFADDQGQATQMVLTAVLPVLTAWVSTVLAYYYSSESMEAATRNVKDIMSLEQKLDIIPVVNVMIGIKNLIYFTYTDDLKIFEVLKKLKEAGKGERIPLLDTNKRPVYMLHKSAIDNSIVTRAVEGVNIKDYTFKELFDTVPELEQLGKTSFGIVGENASLADVKDTMNRIPDCQDVFVTKNGLKDEPVTGLVTNVIIEKYSKI
jgi:hypothetical protein